MMSLAPSSRSCRAEGRAELTWHSPRHSDIKSVLNLKIYFPDLHVTLDHKKGNLVALSQGYEVSLFFVALAS